MAQGCRYRVGNDLHPQLPEQENNDIRLSSLGAERLREKVVYLFLLSGTEKRCARAECPHPPNRPSSGERVG